MKKKNLFQLVLVLIISNYFLVSFTINAFGSVNYSLDIKKDDVYIWEVKEYDEDTYTRIFGVYSESDFKAEGEQQKIKIVEIDDKSDYWKISYDLWEYTDDTDDFNEGADDDMQRRVYEDPGDQAEEVDEISDIWGMWVIPTPYTNYLETFEDEFSHPIINVILEDDVLVVSFNKESIIGDDFEVEITYDTNGVMDQLEYIDTNDDTFVKINLLHESIPSYPVGLVLSIILITCVLSLIVWQRKLSLKKR